MAITLVRIDDRLLHGQIVTRWSKIKDCKGILIVDDDAANDPFQTKIFVNAAPNGVKVGVFTIEDAVQRINKAQTVTNGYFIICKSPRTLTILKEKGGDFGDEVNVGPMSTRPDTLTVGKNCSLTEDEIAAFQELNDSKVHVEFQLTPDEKGRDWEYISEKIDKLRREA